jgi:hypothetical protein
MIELLTTAEMAEADRLTIAAGVAGIALMENAGQAIADGVASRHPAGTRVAIVAGPWQQRRRWLRRRPSAGRTRVSRQVAAGR